jgi:hypothetical protein
VPAGNPDGGQWTDEDGDAELFYVSDDPGEFPEVPENPPPTTRERNRWAVRVARYLVATSPTVQLIRFRYWIAQHARDRIIAYGDKPKFLDQLQREANEPKLGYDIHHIVEQTPARQDGFPESRIEGWRNRVRIPTYKHWEINAWYAKPNPRFDWKSPREYLLGKPWHERYAIGLDALRLFGILK